MSQRMLRVQELLKRELGVILQRDYFFEGTLVTVHDVRVAPNLRNASVYFSVVGPPHAQDKVQRVLNRDHGAIQKKLTSRVVLKYTPQLRFCYDDSVARGVRTLSVIQDLEDTIPDEEEDDLPPDEE